MGNKLTLDGSAEYLNVSKRQVRRLISSGQLPASRIGTTTSVRIDADDLEALLTPVVPNGKP
jgi:excisionase family DNA binding protein